MLRKEGFLKGESIHENDLLSLSNEEFLEKLSFNDRSRLVQKHPEIISRHFDQSVKSMIKLLKNPTFLGYKVIDYW